MHTQLFKNLTVQVLTAITIGALLGHLWPEPATQLKPLGDLFIRLVKMVIGPVVFLTVVTAISSIGDLKKAGKIGIKALLYFEVVTTLSLGLGLLVANLIKPGAGMEIGSHAEINPGQFTSAPEHGALDFLLNIVPDNAVNAFAKGELLQILVFAVLFGAALAAAGGTGKPVETFLEQLSGVFFRIIAIVMRVAPLGALGAMAFTVGKYGIAALLPLAKVMLTVYATMALFIFLVLGSIMRYYGLRLLQLITYINPNVAKTLVVGRSQAAFKAER